MALKLVQAFASKTDSKVAKVYLDHEWEEYRVKCYENGEHLEDADYHTHNADRQSKEDALQTARHWIGE